MAIFYLIFLFFRWWLILFSVMFRLEIASTLACTVMSSRMAPVSAPMPSTWSCRRLELSTCQSRCPSARGPHWEFLTSPPLGLGRFGTKIILFPLSTDSGALNGGGAGDRAPVKSRGRREKAISPPPRDNFFWNFSKNISKEGTLWKFFMAPPFESS